MKKQTIKYSLISFNLFYILILLSNISFNKCDCTNEEPFKKSGTCFSDCNDNELFVDRSCIPISTKETDINEMYNKIVSYYSNINVNSIVNKIYIEGENINYLITTNIIENSDSDSYLLNLGENCINNINEVTSNYYIVLINVINTNYATSSNGIRIFNNNNEKYVLSNLCNKQTINVGIPIEATTAEITLYNKIKNEYGYDIFNIDDSFYSDKCTKFTTLFNTDIALQKRNEIYGAYAKEVCSSICSYQKFVEIESKVYCTCNLGGQEKEKNEIEKESINIKVIKCFNKLGKDIKKNYMFFIMTILCILFILCCIISCLKLSSIISKYVKDFEALKAKFLNYFPKENKEDLKKKKEAEKIEIKNKQKVKEIKEEEDEDDEEEEEEESNQTNLDIKNNNQNNFNGWNNPNYNYFMNNPNLALNPYIQYDQYLQYRQMQQYQMYNQYMMNYMKNLNNNNNINENNKDEEEEYEDEEEEEDDDEEENYDNNEANKNENDKRIKKHHRNFFPEFKELDKNAVYTLKFDYNKIKEYTKKMKKEKEEEQENDNNKNQENENKLNNLDKNDEKKEEKKDEKVNKKNNVKEKIKLKNKKEDLKKVNEKKNKKEKKKNVEKFKNNDIQIYKKK